MPQLRRAAAILAVSAATWAPCAEAADLAPDSIEFAAHEHDLGYRAYVAKQYDEAATHFENAFFAAPNPAELRSAIRARREAGQGARAATLAALGKRRYPDDAALAKVADDTIVAVRSRVFEIKLASPEECQVTVDGKVVVAERAREVRFFVDPGKHELSAGWSDERVRRASVDATAGGSETLTLEPPARAPRPTPAPAAATLAPTPASAKPFGPGVFWVGVGLTAVGAGVTTWSGIDAEDNPGTSAVKADCVGQGPSCPAYQKGVSAQNRTNVLLAATGGVALVTAVVGIFFTSWSRAPDSPTTGVEVVPLLGPGGAGVAGTFR